MTGSSTEFDKDQHLSQFDMVVEFTSRGEPYSPRPGDVLQKGRRRLVLNGPSYCSKLWNAFAQSRLPFCDWDTWSPYYQSVVPNLLLLDGWRVVYREPEAATEPEQRSKA